MKRTGYVFDGLMVLEYQSGNKKSLALLVKRHHKRLCHHAYRYTLDVDASQDIVQDSWGVIIKKLGTLRDPDSFSSWATRIVTRRALDYLNKVKRNKKHLETYEREFNLQDTLEGKNLRLQRLLEAIKGLPENQQTVLRLFYTQEYSLKEIANIMEISVGTTKSRLFHAREKLKKIILKQKQ